MVQHAAALLSAAILAVTPASAPPVRGVDAPPVRVTSCRTIVELHARGAPAQEAIQVSFSNDHDSPADVARFSVRSITGQWKEFTARGSFSKGVVIADRILSSETSVEEHFFSRERSADCALSYVHFTDGSAWTASP